MKKEDVQKMTSVQKTEFLELLRLQQIVTNNLVEYVEKACAAFPTLPAPVPAEAEPTPKLSDFAAPADARDKTLAAINIYLHSCSKAEYGNTLCERILAIAYHHKTLTPMSSFERMVRHTHPLRDTGYGQRHKATSKKENHATYAKAVRDAVLSLVNRGALTEHKGKHGDIVRYGLDESWVRGLFNRGGPRAVADRLYEQYKSRMRIAAHRGRP